MSQICVRRWDVAVPSTSYIYSLAPTVFLMSRSTFFYQILKLSFIGFYSVHYFFSQKYFMTYLDLEINIEVQKDFKSVLTSCTIIIVLSSICVRKCTWGKTKQIKKQKIEPI